MVEQLVERIRQKDQQTEQRGQSQTCLQTAESRRMKTESQRAMSQFYQMYVEELSSVCYRYVPYEEDAKDVLQNSFVKIFTTLPTIEYRSEEALKGWLKRVVANEALAFLRKRKKLLFVESHGEETLMDDGEPQTESLSPDTLHQLISELPDGYRTVVNLYVFEGYSHKQIAELLGITESTSGSQFYYAKRLLAKRIKELTNGK
jgi:RNA polymerase sigma-70 factor (ECF subfamily)